MNEGRKRGRKVEREGELEEEPEGKERRERRVVERTGKVKSGKREGEWRGGR